MTITYIKQRLQKLTGFLTEENDLKEKGTIKEGFRNLAMVQLGLFENTFGGYSPEEEEEEIRLLPIGEIWANNKNNAWESDLTPKDVASVFLHGDEYIESLAEDNELMQYDLDSVEYWIGKLQSFFKNENKIPKTWDIFVDEDGEIIDGYHRLTAAIIIGLKKFPISGQWSPENSKLVESKTLPSLLAFLFESPTKTDETVQKALKDWAENNVEAPRGPYWFPPKELFRYREFHRRTRKDLQKSMREKGFDPQYPIEMFFGKNGVVVIAEGNHRLKTAIQLGIKKIPVVFEFHRYVERYGDAKSEYQQTKDRKLLQQQQKEKRDAAFNKKYGIDKAGEEQQEELMKKIAAMSPEELAKRKAKKDKEVEELMSLLGSAW